MMVEIVYLHGLNVLVPTPLLAGAVLPRTHCTDKAVNGEKSSCKMLCGDNLDSMSFAARLLSNGMSYSRNIDQSTEALRLTSGITLSARRYIDFGEQ